MTGCKEIDSPRAKPLPTLPSRATGAAALLGCRADFISANRAADDMSGMLREGDSAKSFKICDATDGGANLFNEVHADLVRSDEWRGGVSSSHRRRFFSICEVPQ